MTIDWCEGQWVIRNLDGDELARVETVEIRTVSTLCNTDGGRHGWLVVAGKLDVAGNLATITRE